MFVTIVGAVETIGDGIAIQQVSWRKGRAVDFRAVQGAVAADGIGNLLSGLLATVPNTTYSSSVAVVELTWVASRRLGVDIGTGLRRVLRELRSVPAAGLGRRRAQAATLEGEVRAGATFSQELAGQLRRQQEGASALSAPRPQLGAVPLAQGRRETRDAG